MLRSRGEVVMQPSPCARNTGPHAVGAAVVFIAATAVGFFAGCGMQRGAPEGPPAEQPTRGGTFSMAQDAPDGLDPACVDDVYEATLVNQLFEGLCSFDAHLNTIPCIASSWIISPDGTEYLFQLRRSVYFHDGSTVTAEDVVYSLKRAFDFPESEASLARGYLCHIQGTEDYSTGRADSIAGLQIVSPDVVRITLSQPYASFLAVLASELARIVPKHYVEQVGTAEFARHPVGSGPFQMTSWTPDSIVLRRFPQYMLGSAYVDSLVFELPEENARDYAVARLLEGRLSAAVVPDAILEQVRANATTQLLTRQELSLSFIGLSARTKPFDDVRVRRAFAHAIDQRELVRNESTGRVLPNGVLPPGMPGFTPERKILAYDPEQARALLAAAGYPGGVGLPPIVYTSASQSEQAIELFETIRDQVAKAGFELRNELLSWREFSQRLTEQKLQCFTVTWVADIPDPDSFLSPLCLSDGSANFESYSKPEVDALLLQGRGTRSSLERLNVYRRAERLVLGDAPIIPLFHPLSAIAVQNRVRGLQVTSMGVGNLALEKVWFAPVPSPATAPVPDARAAESTRPESDALQGRIP